MPDDPLTSSTALIHPPLTIPHNDYKNIGSKTLPLSRVRRTIHHVLLVLHQQQPHIYIHIGIILPSPQTPARCSAGLGDLGDCCVVQWCGHECVRLREELETYPILT